MSLIKPLEADRNTSVCIHSSVTLLITHTHSSYVSKHWKQKLTVFSFSHSSMPEITHTSSLLHRPTQTRMCPWVPWASPSAFFSNLFQILQLEEVCYNLYSGNFKLFVYIIYHYYWNRYNSFPIFHQLYANPFSKNSMCGLTRHHSTKILNQCILFVYFHR